MEIILASSSPRRHELLNLAKIKHTVIASECDETVPEGTRAADAALLLAVRKARSVYSRRSDALVIGADTVVHTDNGTGGETLLGKPKDGADAAKMLKMLSGRTHLVTTGVCITANGAEEAFSVTSEVEFYSLDDGEIESYLKSGEAYDKAGAYAIQGLGSLFVKRINGDYFNIVGLPLARVYRSVRKMLSNA